MPRFDPLELMSRLGGDWRPINTLDFGRDDIFCLIHRDIEPVILTLIPVPSPCLAIYGNVVTVSSELTIRRALERMDFWTGLEGAGLGLRAETNEITMTELIPLSDGHIKALPETLEAFISSLQTARAEFESLQSEHGDVLNAVQV